MAVVTFKNLAVVVKILITTSLPNYLQGSSVKVLSTRKIPRPVSQFLEIRACDSGEHLSISPVPRVLLLTQCHQQNGDSCETPFVCVAVEEGPNPGWEEPTTLSQRRIASD